MPVVEFWWIFKGSLYRNIAFIEENTWKVSTHGQIYIKLAWFKFYTLIQLIVKKLWMVQIENETGWLTLLCVWLYIEN